MRNRRITGVIIAAVCFGLVSCSEKTKKEGFLAGPVSPSVEGFWAGDMEFETDEVQATISLRQTGINLTGTYHTPACDGTPGCLPSLSAMGAQGTVRGLTTGQTFALDFTSLPADASCPAAVFHLNGQIVSASSLAFNLTGTDCSGRNIRGQGYFNRTS